MDNLNTLKKDVTELMNQASAAMDKQHSGSEFDTRLANMQRGKYVAYAHIISLIDDQLKDKK